MCQVWGRMCPTTMGNGKVMLQSVGVSRMKKEKVLKEKFREQDILCKLVKMTSFDSQSKVKRLGDSND